jgi:hypothetical protein
LTQTWVDGRFPPEFYVFFSVDIEGSTRFKNDVGKSSTWGPFFLEFFHSFPSTLANCEVKLAQLLSSANPKSQFVFCKSLGDELIFAKKLTGGFEAFVAVCAAKQAITDYSKKLREHQRDRREDGEQHVFPTQLKGTMWHAGFPIKNMKVVKDEHPQVPIDYIGPSIDLGFRLAKLSSPWHMSISAPLAWMVAKIQVEHPEKIDNLDIKWTYRGRESLKGVLVSPYPVFCIDVAASADNVGREELTLVEDTRTSARNVVAFCETLFSENGHGRPFIVGDKYGFDIPNPENPECIEYIENYQAFLKTQPVITEPSKLEASVNTDTTAQVLDAIVNLESPLFEMVFK